ncbi:hypothetical protein [Anaerosinus massiliensis]|uniref:hypothetical protein n=1 Tax=Massilibacillus massiliensis TaxID=1806837 RepID=UPI000DA5F45D|nr:hypothetical protein [Massilibacillus massiliensis]
MRIYFDKNLIDDELLKECVTPTHIAKSTAYVEDLANSLGVGAGSIVEPAPFKIQQLAEAYALMEAAKKQSMMNTSGTVEGADAYELKRRVYAAEVDDLTDQITADTFTGGKSAKKRAFPMSVSVYRR